MLNWIANCQLLYSDASFVNERFAKSIDALRGCIAEEVVGVSEEVSWGFVWQAYEKCSQFYRN